MKGPTAERVSVGSTAPPARPAADQPPGTTTGGTPDPHHRTGALRLLLHAAAELPLVIVGVVEMLRGWRPLFDNASIALRSYQVFSRQIPLVGHQVALSAGTQPVFSPGPLENWLLAVPVRLDPAQGALCGAILFAVIGIALAIEAGWSTAQWWGAVAVTVSVLILFAVRGEVAVDVVWNAWFGLVFVITTLATGWAVASGNLRWWPVTVLAASVAAQCQEVNAPAVVLVCAIAPVLGMLVCRHRSHPIRYWPLVAGTAVGALAWSAPVIQQLTHRPGNLSMLWRAANQRGATVGLSQAIGALGAGIRPVPGWVHAPPVNGAYPGFVYVVDIFAGPRWWAILAMALLVVIGIIAWSTDRLQMAGAATISVVAGVGCVVAFAAVPESQFLTFEYLGAVVIPIGTTVWLTLVWALVESIRVLRSRIPVANRPSEAGSRPRTGASSRRPTIPAVILWITASAIACVWGLVSALSLVGTDLPTSGGWAAVRATDSAVAAVVHLDPRSPFRMELSSHLGARQFSVLTGTAYLLDTRGFEARLDGPDTAATYGPVSASMPVVLVTVPDSGNGVTASIERSGPSGDPSDR